MAATYQLASDGYDGNAYSGVIRADGKWVACAADNDLWDEYVAWRAIEGNVPDPWRSPAAGGTAITLEPGQEVVGTMADSLPPAPTPASAVAPAASQPRSEPKPKT